MLFQRREAFSVQSHEGVKLFSRKCHEGRNEKICPIIYLLLSLI